MSLFSVNIFLELCCASFICCFRKKLKHYYLIVSLSKKAYAGHIHGIFCIPVFRLSTWKWKIFDVLFLYPNYKQEVQKNDWKSTWILTHIFFFFRVFRVFPIALEACTLQNASLDFCSFRVSTAVFWLFQCILPNYLVALLNFPLYKLLTTKDSFKGLSLQTNSHLSRVNSRVGYLSVRSCSEINTFVLFSY